MNNKLIIQLSHAVDTITKSSEKVFAKDIAGTRILNVTAAKDSAKLLYIHF